MALDSYYTFYSMGSQQTASAGIEDFWGSYSGLSLLNSNDVIQVQISASVNEFVIGPNTMSPTNNIGYKIYPALSTVTLPPLNVGAASTFKVSRTTGATAQAQWNWVVWTRKEYSN